MKKSICIEKIFLELPFYERFKPVKDAGFDYLEFWTWEDKDIGKVVGLLNQYDLQVVSISGDRMFSPIIAEERGQYLEYLAESLRVAQRLKCKHVVVHSNGIDKGKVTNDGSTLSYAKKIASMTRTLGEAARLAEDAGLTLVVEAVNTYTMPGYFLNNTVEAGDIVRVIGSPNLKILYDIWHMQQMEGNMVRYLTQYIDVLGYVHIGDAPERHEPGTGEINFDRIKRTLKSLGYDGVFGFELVPSESSVKCCEILKAF
jgi:hydroxypyruvate isomerase